ncbi:hypothetical protein C723_0682 [Christiangramia flava JLT2011]|uniref:Uncharacterized protein n=2 Tax=Christiangramia TaxID=292691 RepID=A0A1L7I445_9FLAO|nr:hypothetical protein GRFL_1148 [Christiangramia flava JLT2011]OSS40374.1 hypothetical protein C723_0682 [Christiangramia flava JLT2011]
MIPVKFQESPVFVVKPENYCIINRKNPIFTGISFNKCKKFNDSVQLYYFSRNANFMRKITLLSLLVLMLFSCSGNDDYRGNPNLADLNFSLRLNLTLPEYNQLQYAGNSYVTYNYGVKGIVIYNINGSQFTAFELSDPNHPASSCSGMTVNGVIATCSCEGNSYNIITGEPASEENLQYTMKPYRIQQSGSIIEVWN